MTAKIALYSALWLLLATNLHAEPSVTYVERSPCESIDGLEPLSTEIRLRMSGEVVASQGFAPTGDECPPTTVVLDVDDQLSTLAGQTVDVEAVNVYQDMNTGDMVTSEPSNVLLYTIPGAVDPDPEPEPEAQPETDPVAGPVLDTTNFPIVTLLQPAGTDRCDLSVRSFGSEITRSPDSPWTGLVAVETVREWDLTDSEQLILDGQANNIFGRCRPAGGSFLGEPLEFDFAAAFDAARQAEDDGMPSTSQPAAPVILRLCAFRADELLGCFEADLTPPSP